MHSVIGVISRTANRVAAVARELTGVSCRAAGVTGVMTVVTVRAAEVAKGAGREAEVIVDGVVTGVAGKAADVTGVATGVSGRAGM